MASLTCDHGISDFTSGARAGCPAAATGSSRRRPQGRGQPATIWSSSLAPALLQARKPTRLSLTARRCDSETGIFAVRHPANRGIGSAPTKFRSCQSSRRGPGGSTALNGYDLASHASPSDSHAAQSRTFWSPDATNGSRTRSGGIPDPPKAPAARSALIGKTPLPATAGFCLGQDHVRLG